MTGHDPDRQGNNVPSGIFIALVISLGFWLGLMVLMLVVIR